MSPCHVCGRENLDEATHCASCAAALPPPLAPPAPLESTSPIPSPPPAAPALPAPPHAPEAPALPVSPGPAALPALPQPPALPPLPAPPAEPGLNAKTATLILVVYLAVQIGIGFFASIVIVSFASLHGVNLQRPEVRAQVLHQKVGIIGILSIPPAALAMILMSRARARRELTDTTATGAAWTLGAPRPILLGLGTGVLAGAGYLGLSIALTRPTADTQMGPLASLAFTPGFPQVIWLIGALLFAPVSEELLFRGVLYGGYRKSMGPAAAAALTTFIFWLLHINETIYFPPAMVSVAALALLALWFRLRAAAIGPAVALHLGYNAVVAAAALFGPTS